MKLEDDGKREELWEAAFQCAFRDAFREGEDEDGSVVEATLGEVPGYCLLEEIGRGGLGVVHRARDEKLGRRIAIKRLRPSRRDPELVERFLDEARVAAQLQHPGIVPIHELGSDASGAPFIAMKLVEGRTLATCLREERSRDPEAYLWVFPHVCHAVAYAHDRGVVHRDLKTQNVMVGSFGEVQVMDWGLALVRDRGEKGDHDDGISTLRGSAAESLFASVLGTPSCMPPEQARAERESIDERADVFALGALLFTILTREPLYEDDPDTSALDKARRGDHEAERRLRERGVETRLRELCLECLRGEVSSRPRDASVVAERIETLLAVRAKKAEERRLELAAARERARSERKRRRLSLALAASVVSLLVVLAVFDRIERRRDDEARKERELALREALELAEDLADREAWDSLVLALDQAEKLRAELEPEGRERIAAARQRLLRRRDVALEKRRENARDEAFVRRIEEALALPANSPSSGDAEFAEAFRLAGIDVDRLPVEEAAAIIAARDPKTRELVVRALESWAARRFFRPEAQRRLLDLTRLVDPDPFRNAVRDALGRGAAEELAALASRVVPSRQPAATLDLLAVSLARFGERETALSLLANAVRAHPSSIWINLHLAALHSGILKPDRDHREGGRADVDLDAALRYALVARALQPKSAFTHHILVSVLRKRGELEEAERVGREAVARCPEDPTLLYSLARVLSECGRSEEAVTIAKNVLELRPEHLAARLFLRRHERSEAADPSGESFLRTARQHALAGRWLEAARSYALHLSRGQSPRLRGERRGPAARRELWDEILSAYLEAAIAESADDRQSELWKARALSLLERSNRNAERLIQRLPARAARRVRERLRRLRDDPRLRHFQADPAWASALRRLESLAESQPLAR